MPSPWIPAIENIINGEPVDQQVANRPHSQLAQRTEYLREILDAIGAGRSSFDVDSPLSPSVEVGMALYWNADLKEFAPAIASLEFTSNGNFTGRISDQSYVVGVCTGKTSSTRGTVTFWGRVPSLDVSNVLDDQTPGPKFLSPLEAGKFVSYKPPVGIYSMFVQVADDPTQAEVIIMPSPREVLEDHIHYALNLETTVAATSGDQGWLVAGDPSFGGLAPAGAVYGYNINQDPAVYELFPFSRRRTSISRCLAPVPTRNLLST